MAKNGQMERLQSHERLPDGAGGAYSQVVFLGGGSVPARTNSQPLAIEVPGVGPVTFTRHQRAKRINIVLKPFRGVRVTVPWGVSYARAAAFLADKRGWLKTHLQKMSEVEARLAARPEQAPTVDLEAARRVLPRRLAELAERHGYTYNRVTIRCQKTRWGSCSARNNISLNARLLTLPPELMDFVLLHELVHTRIKNHGPEFWGELERVAGQARAKTARLKGYPLAVI
jgi:predicted metal-dependent hydrolase